MQLQALAMGLNCRVNSSLFCKQTEQDCPPTMKLAGRRQARWPVG